MNRNDEYISQSFNWFIGEVLDINDTVLYSRVKVRAYGYYDETVSKEDLPWATVLLPNTSASEITSFNKSFNFTTFYNSNILQ